MRVLHNKGDTPMEEEVPLGRLVLEDFWKGFQGYVDKLAWREARLCVRLSLLCTRPFTETVVRSISSLI